ncbi:hypothetical protein YPPY66_3217 [Yersinia pestis PY-66]|uniref:Uncharacterized protein n=1 Tax=Yersinia pestis PY-08 TaxID=992134 RepID=A0AB72ZIA1_YERPE|nr:hypothetical protein YPC_1559 [Yersinia pestis biovar Medievalis str. Harbin 35]EDR44824.1 hypothetical protein YpE1979001_1778 [Yersinia pestis biovar Antiqua str. E1979001]EDR49488.1 hypothetical protein YpB42003004_0092 [Yersinia pestis biovar Antiqua str. B42003004]EDR66444.1 hypothetical protein YpK1973002_3570 [Yersinia pestis biovar Mediaevalis str. K1973002]EEO76203.1 hypothetical protein YP516_2400 [Yersinia pestis Nepal516]EEO80277.1 hypothetical protein YPF_3093 [Yersinia pestis 
MILQEINHIIPTGYFSVNKFLRILLKQRFINYCHENGSFNAEYL